MMYAIVRSFSLREMMNVYIGFQFPILNCCPLEHHELALGSDGFY